ncbi:hypothetical protein Dimus_009871, partial [Dionaea muscipula]
SSSPWLLLCGGVRLQDDGGDGAPLLSRLWVGAGVVEDWARAARLDLGLVAERWRPILLRCRFSSSGGRSSSGLGNNGG